MKIKKKNLVLTKIFYPNKLDSVLLGEWCVPDIDKHNQIIIDYHWKDKKKLFKDIKYLDYVYEELLKSISLFLNNFHKTNYSIKFWRIYVGPWLGYYLHIIFDRFETIKKAIGTFKFSSFDDLNYSNINFRAKNIEEFLYLINTDIWNQKTYSQILKFLDRNKEIKINTHEGEKKNLAFQELIKAKEFLNNKSKNKRTLFLKIYENLFKNVTTKQKHFIIDTYLGNKNEIKLNFLLKQLPIFFYDNVLNDIKDKSNLRYENNLKHPKNDIFNEFISDHIISNIPLSFIEGFKLVEKKVNQKGWPTEPKTIFTSHALLQKTLPSFYTAQKKELYNTKLIHGQHGGAFGQLSYMWHEEHEKKISDKYLNWGWEQNTKSIPVGRIKPINEITNIIKKNNLRDKILLIPRTQPLYSNELIDTRFRSSEMINHLDECEAFIKKLKKKLVNENLVVRLHSKKYGWNEYDRFKNFDQNIKIDFGEKKIKDTLKETKLCVFTYNATGYLETFAGNFPTIIFWNTGENLHRNETKKYFDILKSNNIFFENSTDAAIHLNNVWEDIEGWWNNEDTQYAIKLFCEKYSKENKKKLSEIKKIILENV